MPGYNEYEFRVNAPGGSRETIAATPLISVPNAPQLANPVAQVAGVASGDATAKAIGGIGGELAAMSAKLYDGEQATRATQGLTQFLTKREELVQKYEQDPDYATAPKRFQDDISFAHREALEKIDDPQVRGRLDLELTRSSLSGANRVRERQLQRQGDINGAALDRLETQSVTDTLAAKTPEEALAVQTRFTAETERMANAGWIDHRTALARTQRFMGNIETAQAHTLMVRDPARAIDVLNNPQNFQTLDPTRRANLIIAAEERRENNNIATLSAQAPYHPTAAMLTVGRVGNLESADRIFRDGILPTENATGDNSLVSEKGAVGVSQILPSTARDVAKSLGMRDIAGLSDEALKARLISDTKLNRELGQTYFRQMVTRYDGNISLAAAAYNAGPGRADEWKKSAEARFGPAFSAGQLQSVIGIAETRDYIGKLYNQVGAATDIRFLSPSSQLRASNGIGAAVAQVEARETQIVKLQASANRSDEPIAQLLQDGYDVAPERRAAYRSAQQAAAARGDTEARKALADLDFAERLEPHIRRAWAIPPAQLDAEVEGAQAMLSNSPNVTGEQRDRLTALVAVRDEIVKLKNTDPLALGARAGYFPPVMVDTAAQPESDGFKAQLAARGAQAMVVQKLYQGDAGALRPMEAEAMKERFAQAGPEERFRIVRTLAETLPGRAYDDTLKQIGGEAASFVGRLAQTRPEIAKEIFTGMALQNSEAVKGDVKELKAALANTLGGQLYPSTTAQSQVVEAAMALYTARRATGQLYDAADAGAIERALEDVTGPIVKRNGVKVASPPGMTAAQFDRTLDRMSDVSFDAFGGAYDKSGKPFTAEFLKRQASLIQREPGSTIYMVQVGGQPVFQAPDAASGMRRPLIIDMSALPKAAQRPLTPYQQARQNVRDASSLRYQETLRSLDGGDR